MGAETRLSYGLSNRHTALSLSRAGWWSSRFIGHGNTIDDAPGPKLFEYLTRDGTVIARDKFSENWNGDAGVLSQRVEIVFVLDVDLPDEDGRAT